MRLINLNKRNKEMGVAHFSWWLVPATLSFVMFQMT